MYRLLPEPNVRLKLLAPQASLGGPQLGPNVRHMRLKDGGTPLEDICCLDREALGRMAFWHEFRLAAKEKARVKILTHKKDMNELPIDLKLLLKRVADNDQGLGAILGLSEGNRYSPAKVSAKTVGIATIGLITVGVVVFIRNLYNFKIFKDPDGTVTIDGEPQGA